MMQQLSLMFQHLGEKWVGELNHLPEIIFSASVILAFYVLSRIVYGIVKRFGIKHHASPDVIRFLAKASKFIIMVIGVVMALSNMGVNPSSIFTGLSLCTAAIGLALKDSLSNLLYGMMIIFYKRIDQGTRLKVQDAEGVVVRIDLRFTTIEVEGGDQKLIPNSILFTQIVTLKK
jgi:small conductance mechanosensitive channel